MTPLRAKPAGAAVQDPGVEYSPEKQAALDYHEGARPGKIEVVPTKPTRTQRELSLAYTPGVAEPCRAIAEDRSLVSRY
ncbi:MAG TPA: hypothetical protein VHM19_12945, partial [Polyangiales bacterium]|nr:hypothetical protein [Polyangiales bacterium]